MKPLFSRVLAGKVPWSPGMVSMSWILSLWTLVSLTGRTEVSTMTITLLRSRESLCAVASGVTRPAMR